MEQNKKTTKFFGKIDIRKLSGTDFDLFIKEITYVNFVRSKIFIVVLIIIFLAMINLDLLYIYFEKSKTSPGYRILFYAHWTMLLLMTVAAILARCNPVEKPDQIRKFHRIYIKTLLFAGLINIVVISGGDALINGSIAAFMGSVFAVASIFLIPNLFCTVLFLSGIFMMVIFLKVTEEMTGVSLTIQIVNAVTFSLIAMVLSRILFYYELQDFQKRQMIQRQKEKLEELATRDHLTNAMNRRSFAEMTTVELSRANRYRRPLSLSIFDLDHFKQVNDRFGHLVGDEVLKHISLLVKENIRATDTLVRWGGEEFIILAPETDLQSMVAFSEKLRKLIEADQPEKAPAITASFGVAQYRWGESEDDFLNRADQALMQAKQTGRNRVVELAEDHR